MPRRSVKLRFYENLEANSIEFNGVPRRSFEMIDTIVRLRLNGFGATDFASCKISKRSLVEAAGIEPVCKNLNEAASNPNSPGCNYREDSQ
jgi:hypothetical protein